LGYVKKQYSRYRKNVNREGTMREYLKEYGDVFNLVWLQLILDPAGEGVQ
jgi:hypothetical protein